MAPKKKGTDAVSGQCQDETAMDDAQALARARAALEARLARLAPGEAEAAAAKGPEPPAGPALCPRRLCRRKGACRRPRSGACALYTEERMRAGIAGRLRALRLGAGGAER